MNIFSKTSLLSTLVSLLCLGCGFRPVNEPMLLSSSLSHEILPLKSAHEGDTIRLLCWNIHKENDRPSFQAALNDLLKPDEYMLRQNPSYGAPDIFLFQEVFMSSPEDASAGKTNPYFGDLINASYNMDWVFAPNLVKGDTYGGVLTGSSFRPVDARAFISDSCEYVTKTPKACLVTLYDLGRGSAPLMVVNVHGINIKPGLAEFKRQISRVADVVKKHDGPVILAGDFNTWRFGRYDWLDKLASDMGFERVAFQKTKQTRSFMGLGYPLDHIYISRDTLAVVDGSALALDGLSVSDHIPLWVELKIL